MTTENKMNDVERAKEFNLAMKQAEAWEQFIELTRREDDTGPTAEFLFGFDAGLAHDKWTYIRTDADLPREDGDYLIQFINGLYDVAEWGDGNWSGHRASDIRAYRKIEPARGENDD